MKSKHYRIHIRKEALKFSAAHMTVFADGTKEALHGHNYRTEVTIGVNDASLAGMASFHEIKAATREVCASWDEKVLLARKCPFLKIAAESSSEVDFTLCGKHYVLPSDEVVWLAMENVVTETLAEEFCRLLVAKLRPEFLAKQVIEIEARVDEITGQGASFIWKP